ncbi:glycosyltransferase [Halomonas mongoliensis]|uniref:Glycosyltransferase n=1 Tax=Halomonas mongoliensis TaxID=321265 RepID=A0ABU1GQN6_9GAMM|nr:glycosyltransferase [Halomonas mongoliensis]MDR5894331.1 glycosyltransferase [Halomonas mongoliensis]
MIKTLHVINGLGQGGAERQLSNLVSYYPSESAIFSIMTPGIMADEVRCSGVKVYSGESHRAASIGWVSRLRLAIREFQPDVIVGWMYHGNLAASLSRRLGFSGPILWNVRHSLHDLNKEKVSTRWVIRAGSWLSSTPEKIVYNSAAAASQHEAMGFPHEKRIVLPNGFDLERFKPDAEVRKKVREELGIPYDFFLFGVVGRSHPMKNHLGWVEALKKINLSGKKFACVIVGSGVSEPDGALAAAVREAALNDIVTLLPAQTCPEKIYPALDLLVMPSLWGEGFPNVVGEAMACGVPALVTNVGDAAIVVGKTGFVVDSGEPKKLAKSALEIMELDQGLLKSYGCSALERVEHHYGLPAVAQAYGKLIKDAIS